jgi:hypothetical protein
MNSETIVTRARSALGKKTRYESPGVMPDLAAAVWPGAGSHTDCSGFVAWCLRFERKIDHPFYKKVNGGWFETSGIYADGLASVGFFTEIDKPRPGALLVYPDYKSESGKNHDGHIGIVTQVAPQGSGITAVEKIVHCSLGGWNKLKDAVQETTPVAWLAKPKSIIVWLDGTT